MLDGGKVNKRFINMLSLFCYFILFIGLFTYFILLLLLLLCSTNRLLLGVS